MPQPRILIVQMGVPPAAIRAQVGEQAHWFAAALGDRVQQIEVRYPMQGDALPSPESFDAAILTGSWAMVSDREDWSERVAAWIPAVMQSGRKLLGVCYGHQLMAHALGGHVDYHPRGREVGMHQITLTDAGHHDPLLSALNSPAFAAHLSHEQSVLRLPPGAVVLGHSAHDPHQILRYSPSAISFQFHPEFTPAVMTACIQRRAEAFAADGLDVDAMLQALAPTTDARALLREFVCGSP